MKLKLKVITGNFQLRLLRGFLILVIKLDGNSLTFQEMQAIAEGKPIALKTGVAAKMQRSRSLVEKAVKSGKPVYGINTGFGYFARVAIPKNKQKELQHHILVSHAAGFGPPLSLAETRVAMALRLNSLAKGYTGVRYELAAFLLKLIQAEIYPLIPQYGSVGASGDLAPLAHLALPLIGKGKVFYKGKEMTASAALKKAGLKPLSLVEKEGLGLINGTQIMLACGGLSFVKAKKLLPLADCVAALSLEAMLGHPEALDKEIHHLRNQTGQIASSKEMRAVLQGSFLHKKGFTPLHLQDPYSLRCAPQVHGATRDAFDYMENTLRRELNAGTDNPLVFPETGEILSGGNFHGQPLALAFDMGAISLSEIGNIADRRLELLSNPHLSGLPAFLSPEEGLQSGYMALQYLSAALVSETKVLSHPASLDSVPGNGGIEDLVSMGMTSALKFRQVVDHVETILAIETLASAQAIDLRNVGPLGKGTGRLYRKLRKKVPFLGHDRIIAEDIRKAKEVLEDLL